MMEEINGLFQIKYKGVINGCLNFDVWFVSKRSDEFVKDIGDDLVGIFQTSAKGVCKYTIKNTVKNFPGVSYRVFNIIPMVPRDSPLVDIEYKYNSHKALYSIATEGGGREDKPLFPIYISTLIGYLIFPLDLLFFQK